MKNKLRLDILLVNRGLFPSREQARAAIMAGEVLVDEQKLDKAGAAVDEQARIRLLGKRLPYVSRGGLKLAKAIDCFGIDLQGKLVLDIGASTGGFVDCALQHGARHVYAVDVGYGQLDWSLRSDARVTTLEKTNARFLSRELVEADIDVITADVSFISLTLALPAAIDCLLKPGGELAALVKPQFEAGREHVGKGGVVRDRKVHQAVLEKLLGFCTEQSLSVRGLSHSPITGADGNIEYLLYAVKTPAANADIDIAAAIAAAWEEHRQK
ncbi:MAG: TlyA family RNA methyltransferase [Bacillota bacterium]|nr:TlyA family RNA methyltransferase [Bacillota bacterium]